MRQLWPAGAEFRVRVPAGCGAVPHAPGQALLHHGSGKGQPAILLPRQAVRKEDRALRLQGRISTRRTPDHLDANPGCPRFSRRVRTCPGQKQRGRWRCRSPHADKMSRASLENWETPAKLCNESCAFLLSLPARGAWIEICAGRRRCSRWTKSLPARGAWIEIISCPYPRPRPASLPARGAWIEIIVARPPQQVKIGRSPQGERGLKYSFNIVNCIRNQSLPARGEWIEIAS